MKTEKVILTEAEIQLIITAMEEKTDRLKALHLNDKTRLNNLIRLTHYLESHI